MLGYWEDTQGNESELRPRNDFVVLKQRAIRQRPAIDLTTISHKRSKTANTLQPMAFMHERRQSSYERKLQMSPGFLGRSMKKLNEKKKPKESVKLKVLGI